MQKRTRYVAGGFLLAALAGCHAAVPGSRPAVPGEQALQTVRCAVIGGMTRTGLWQAVSERFEKATGHRVVTVVTGPKDVIAPAMREGQVDLITMHASDTIINLVAEGYATDPWPWAMNDLVIVGPSDDPAGIHGLTDAAEAMRRVAATKCRFVVHQSLGAMDVLRAILRSAAISYDPEVLLLPEHNPELRILEYAEGRHAYTLVGRIPFLDGKMPKKSLELMVKGDPRLRRPYVVAVANPKRWPDARCRAARELADFLRQPATQAWLAEFGRGELDDQPLFFPVAAEAQKR